MEIYGYIYKIECLANNKIYIGKTKNGFDKRYYINKNDNPIIGFYKTRVKEKRYKDDIIKDIDIYGFNNFKVNKRLEVAFSKQELNVKERVYINLYKKNIYNVELYNYDFIKTKEYIRIKIKKEDEIDIINLLNSNGYYLYKEK